MIDIKFHSNVIFVSNIDISKTFYTKVLGFCIAHDFGTNISFENGISIWQIHDDHVIIQNKLDTVSKSNRMELYFETTNIEETYQNLKDNGVAFFHELLEEPWGQKNIRFFDPDKHLIEIGESLETFVTRMSNEGMTVDELSEKTGIPKNTVQELLELE